MKQKTNRFNRERLTEIALFLLLLICYTYTFPRWADPNQNSRLDMVFAVIEDGTLQIDRYVENTVDYAKFEGHYYSDKAPGVAFLGIPAYGVLKTALDLPIMDGLMTTLSNNQALTATLREDGTGLQTWKLRFAIAQVLLTFVGASLPTALLGVMLYRIATAFTANWGYRLLVVLSYGLLTPAFAYAGAFYGHQLSAMCLFGVFYLVFTRQQSLSIPLLLIAGFLLGYSVITEYPSVLVVAIMVLYILYNLYRFSDWRRIGWVILTGSILAIGLMVYNTTIYHSPLELGYSYSELWVDQHHTGFMSLTLPHSDAIWGITFSRFRGLFILSPWLLLALPGFVLWWRFGEYRPELVVTIASVLSFFFFNTSSIMWWGGFSIGPRYLLPILPFLTLPVLYTLRCWGNLTWFRILIAVLLGWSLVAVWGLTLAEQAFPPDTIRNPFVEYAWPNWKTGNIARNMGMFLHLKGTSSLIPLMGMWVIFSFIFLYIYTKPQKKPTSSKQPISKTVSIS